jgi:hypothetical protein
MEKEKTYIGFWLILALGLALFVTLSALEPIKIGDIELRTTGMYERLTREPEPTPEEIAAAKQKEAEEKAAKQKELKK